MNLLIKKITTVNCKNLFTYNMNHLPQKKDKIRESIDLICNHHKPFIKKSLENLMEKTIENTEIICNYIKAEQNEINIKESTKEGR